MKKEDLWSLQTSNSFKKKTYKIRTYPFHFDHKSPHSFVWYIRFSYFVNLRDNKIVSRQYGGQYLSLCHDHDCSSTQTSPLYYLVFFHSVCYYPVVIRCVTGRTTSDYNAMRTMTQPTGVTNRLPFRVATRIRHYTKSTGRVSSWRENDINTSVRIETEHIHCVTARALDNIKENVKGLKTRQTGLEGLSSHFWNWRVNNFQLDVVSSTRYHVNMHFCRCFEQPLVNSCFHC